MKNVIIMGGGKTAVRAALETPDYMNVKIIEKSAERCEKLNQLLADNDTMVIHGDGRDLGLLEEEGIKSATRASAPFVVSTGCFGCKFWNCGRAAISSLIFGLYFIVQEPKG